MKISIPRQESKYTVISVKLAIQTIKLTEEVLWGDVEMKPLACPRYLAADRLSRTADMVDSSESYQYPDDQSPTA